VGWIKAEIPAFVLVKGTEKLKIQPMDALQQLSRREREIMEIVFVRRRATLSEIQEKMHEAPTRPALRSLLTILEDKKLLKHSKKGLEFVFQPVDAPEKAGCSALGRVFRTFFEGSVGRALASYLSDPRSRLTEEDIRELSAFIDDAKTRTRKKQKDASS